MERSSLWRDNRENIRYTKAMMEYSAKALDDETYLADDV